jgi:GT2 family glycosyltransferase
MIIRIAQVVSNGVQLGIQDYRWGTALRNSYQNHGIRAVANDDGPRYKSRLDSSWTGGEGRHFLMVLGVTRRGVFSKMLELSVIIATYNRAERLKCCLDALGKQTLASSSFEVVVVVDGANDGTMQMLRGYRPPFPLRVVWQQNSGQAVALNRGIEEARGRYCLFLDDDIIASPETLAEHLRAQQSPGDIVAVGQLTLKLPKNAGWYARAFAEGWRRHYDALNRGQAGLTWEGCYSGNMSAPRRALLTYGGFDAGLPRGFDVELAYRLEESGCTLRYLRAAIGCQDERKGFQELSRDAEAAGEALLHLCATKRVPCASALQSFRSGDALKIRVTRILLTLQTPPQLLAIAGILIPSRKYQYLCYRLIHNFCVWRGIRRAASGTDLWSEINGRVS